MVWGIGKENMFCLEFGSLEFEFVMSWVGSDDGCELPLYAIRLGNCQ